MTEDQALAQLAEILARPEYHADQSTPWWQQLLAPVLDFVWGVLDQLYQVLVASSSGREGPLGVVAVVLSVAVLAGAATYLVRAVRLSVVREAAVHSASLAARRERSDQLWQAAQALAARGEWSDAVRMLYLSALYALDERSLLHVNQTLTNREHALRLRAEHPALAASFADLLDHYERVRYGQAEVAPTTFEDLTIRATKVRTAALAA